MFVIPYWIIIPYSIIISLQVQILNEKEEPTDAYYVRSGFLGFMGTVSNTLPGGIHQIKMSSCVGWASLYLWYH